MNWTFELLGLFLLLLLALLTAAQLVRHVGEALLEPLVGISDAEETSCCSGRPTEPCLLGPEAAGNSAVRLSGC